MVIVINGVEIVDIDTQLDALEALFAFNRSPGCSIVPKQSIAQKETKSLLETGFSWMPTLEHYTTMIEDCPQE